jgi:hypothetical protein
LHVGWSEGSGGGKWVAIAIIEYFTRQTGNAVEIEVRVELCNLKEQDHKVIDIFEVQ